MITIRVKTNGIWLRARKQFKKFGYMVVRFTGSQVYNKPLSCVDTLVKIILNDITNKVNNNARN